MTTYLFIDGGYLRRNYANAVHPWFGSDGEIDFFELKKSLQGSAIERCFYYDALEDEQRDGETKDEFDQRIVQDETLFHKVDELDGFFVRLGSLTGGRNRRQKKVDILLAVEALDHAVRRNMDRAILLTGDRDFEPLVNSLVQLGIRVEIVGDRLTTSKHLRRAADVYKPLRFKNYHEWTIHSLRLQFPITVMEINFPPERARPIETASLQGRTIDFLTCDAPAVYYVYAEDFHRTGQHLALQSNDAARLKLFTELQYGKVEWRKTGGTKWSKSLQ